MNKFETIKKLSLSYNRSQIGILDRKELIETLNVALDIIEEYQVEEVMIRADIALEIAGKILNKENDKSCNV